MSDKIKDWVFFISILLVAIIAYITANTAIKNAVAKQTQEIQEKYVREKAEDLLKCEEKFLANENELKKQIIELQTELEKTKLLLEKAEKEKNYKELAKKDSKTFMKEVDKSLGVRGKSK